MIAAALVFFGAVLLGAILRCLLPPVRHKDIFVSGRPVELVSLEQFRVTWGVPRHVSRLAVRKRADGSREVTEVPAWEAAASQGDRLFALVMRLDGLWCKK